MTQTMTALYDTRGAAESVRDELVALGIATSEMSIRSADTQATTGSTTGTEDKGFWASLSDLFMPDEDRYAYAEGIRRGGYLLTVRVPDGLEDRTVEVMERYDPIDVDERATSWRQEGWTGGTGATGTTGYTSTLEAGGATGSSYVSDTGTSTTSTAGYTDTTAATGTTGTDETIQLAEEELRVGKRETAGGRVRVRTYVTERPVEAQVDLQSERVTIERRPVDRDVAPGEAAFQERSLEATERSEEAVVAKTARVKEEIALHKDVESRTETIRDTVRSTDVEVEDDRTGHGRSTGTDPSLRRDPDKI
jgi:uncharacterized protein (TIGR02271 family)